MDLIRWNNELARMREEMRHLFPDIPQLPPGGLPFTRMQSPSVDVRETEKEVVVSAEIPGVNPEELDVTVDENQVILRGEIKRSAGHEREGYRVMERRFGAFHRTIPLPAEVKPDEAWAEYKDGVLEIRMNKSDRGRERSRKLKINRTH